MRTQPYTADESSRWFRYFDLGISEIENYGLAAYLNKRESAENIGQAINRLLLITDLQLSAEALVVLSDGYTHRNLPLLDALIAPLGAEIVQLDQGSTDSYLIALGRRGTTEPLAP